MEIPLHEIDYELDETSFPSTTIIPFEILYQWLVSEYEYPSGVLFVLLAKSQFHARGATVRFLGSKGYSAIFSNYSMLPNIEVSTWRREDQEKLNDYETVTVGWGNL